METTNHQLNGSGQADPRKPWPYIETLFSLYDWGNADLMFKAAGMTGMFVKFKNQQTDVQILRREETSHVD